MFQSLEAVLTAMGAVGVDEASHGVARRRWRGGRSVKG